MQIRQLITALLLAAAPAYAALSASTAFEVRTGGSDTNGGGYVTGASGTDYSQQAAAAYAVTDAVTAGTTTITSATAAFGVADMPGNICYVQGGTGSVTAGWYQIISRTSATAIVVDRTTGLTAGTGVTLNCGGALKSPGVASALLTVTGQIAYIKNDGSVFSVTSASANVANGVISNSNQVYFVGYTTPGAGHRAMFNTDTQPTIQLNVGSATLITGSSSTATAVFNNIILDGNLQASAIASNSGVFIGVGFTKFTSASLSNGLYIGCSATANTSITMVGGTTGGIYFSEAYSNTGTGMSGNTYRSLSYGNSSDGFTAGNIMVGNTAYNNGRDGFNVGTGSVGILIDNYSESNVRNGYLYTNSLKMAVNNAAFGNATNVSTTGTVPGAGLQTTGFLTLTASALNNTGTFDFGVNSTAGGGAVLRAAAYPLLFPRGTTASANAIGASNPSATGGGQVGYAIQ